MSKSPIQADHRCARAPPTLRPVSCGKGCQAYPPILQCLRFGGAEPQDVGQGASAYIACSGLAGNIRIGLEI